MGDILLILSSWGPCPEAPSGYGLVADPILSVTDCINEVGWDEVALLRCIEAAMLASGQ